MCLYEPMHVCIKQRIKKKKDFHLLTNVIANNIFLLFKLTFPGISLAYKLGSWESRARFQSLN